MTTKKIISITFLVVFSLVIAGGGIYFLAQQSAKLPSKEVGNNDLSNPILAKDIIYKINNGQEEKIFALDLTASSTVFSVLQALGQDKNLEIKFKEYPEMGILVESIGGVANGQDNKYWQYWVNDVLGDVASDKKLLKPGDKVEWKFDIAPAF